MGKEDDQAEIKNLISGYKEILSKHELIKKRIAEARKPIDPDWYEKSIQRKEEADKRFRRRFWLIASPFLILGLWVWFSGRNNPPEPVKYEDLSMCEQMWLDADPLYDRYCVPE